MANAKSPLILIKGEEPTLVQKTFTQNGTYSAQDETPPADGFSQVVVNVLPTSFRQLVDGSIINVTAEDLNGCSMIKAGAFQNCNDLISVSLPQSVKKIDNTAFKQCRNLSSINTRYVETFSQGTFFSCNSVTNIDFSSAIGTIPYECCLNCHAITRVVLPDTINKIGARSFRSCLSLQAFILRSSTVVALDNADALQNTSQEPTANYPIYAPTPDDYKVATNWSVFANRIFPLVATVTDLDNIDTATYTKACVIGGDESYKEYAYDGSAWNEVV